MTFLCVPALAAAIVDGEGRPAVGLPIDAPETGRIYRISEVRVE